MSFKRLGGRACLACVSFAPSKIPYGGFSPVRLQTGFCNRNLRSRELICDHLHACSPYRTCRSMSATGVSYVHSWSRGPWLAGGLCCPTRSSLTMASSEPLGFSSRFRFRTLYGRSLPVGGNREVPQFTLRVRSARAAFRTPVDRTGDDCSRFRPHWPSPQSGRARLPTVSTQVGSRVGGLSGLQSSLYATARTVAGPSPTRAFTFELSPQESPP